MFIYKLKNEFPLKRKDTRDNIGTAGNNQTIKMLINVLK